ncbi:MAG: hypothetical protein CVV49_16990 [Spirochaetae bacterium HGW-Spirochaetae-5]|nr:MAG: hypothetical protein CVV49_16990 [Spirochaetae bacterium HGW-Spirochaetae-5]
MSRKYKNYFDDIKNTKAHDKFIEHIIRLFFFAFILSIEAVYKKSKEILQYIKNILKRRTFSDVLRKYRDYKESVNAIIHNHPSVHNIHDRIHETMNRLFNDEEKKLIFGIKDPKQIFMEKSKQIISSVAHYTGSMKNRHFKHIPFTGTDRNISPSMLTLYILTKYKNHKSNFTHLLHSGSKKEFVHAQSIRYKKFINETFSKFYSNDFKNKVSRASLDLKSLKPQIKKIYDAIEKLEKKQMKYIPGQS